MFYYFCAIFANINEIIKIAMIKVCTTKITGKYVRVFLAVLSISFIVVSCEKQNDFEDPRDNITGTWKCQEIDKNNKTINFEATISKNNSDSTKIWVDNFSALEIKVIVGLGGYLLTIPQQTVDGYKISGTGSVASSYNKINWNYSIDDGGGKENFTATFTR